MLLFVKIILSTKPQPTIDDACIIIIDGLSRKIDRKKGGSHMQTYITKLEKLDNKLNALVFSEALIFWDAATLAPKNSVKGRSQALIHMSEFYYNTLINDDVKELLSKLDLNRSELEPLVLSRLDYFKEEFNQISCIPIDEYAAFKGLQALSGDAWEKAKETNDYALFEPYLQQIIDFKIKYIGYRNLGGHPYNTLLNEFEKGLTVEIADQFFSELRSVIVPLVKSIKNSGISYNSPFENIAYSIKGQKEFSQILLDKLGFNKDSGILAESMHPFTMNLTPDDVRITTIYDENNILSSIYSTIHECGHALYEQNISKELGFSRLATGTTMGIHESQSRIYENNIARTLVFWETYLPDLKKIYKEELKDATPLDCFRASNDVKASFVRIEADELTYSLHIMVRYELEKQIMEGKLSAKELPKAWNDLYQSYLGITPSNDTEGILQDVHWSDGLFGYFPSYALGSAYAAQFEQAMGKEFDVKKAIADDKLSLIKDWLNTNIHQYGSTKTPAQLIQSATGEAFDPKYFIDYLVKKFSALYNL